jgi:hypothetical protein
MLVKANTKYYYNPRNGAVYAHSEDLTGVPGLIPFTPKSTGEFSVNMTAGSAPNPELDSDGKTQPMLSEDERQKLYEDARNEAIQKLRDQATADALAEFERAKTDTKPAAGNQADTKEAAKPGVQVAKPTLAPTADPSK